MSSRYPAAWLDELRSRSDIVQIVSGYVALNKKGRKYWGLCPFHGEKTPSFSVDGEHQLYYCFGCKAGGNYYRYMYSGQKICKQKREDHYRSEKDIRQERAELSQEIYRIKDHKKSDYDPS